jgi:predicted nuclease of predicted toxin-antitoxin system
VDVSAGIGVAQWLAAAGHDTVSVRAPDPRMADVDILALAVREQRLILPMDRDFGELIYHSGQAPAGVLLLRRESATAAAKVRVVEQILTHHAAHVPGAFSVSRDGRLRIRLRTP